MTVITQSDFDFSNNAGLSAIPGGADGVATLYVSGGGGFPDPPSGAGTEGDYCRGFLVPAGGGGVAGTPIYTQPWIKDSVGGGVFHGAQPTNQTYSLRAWLRCNSPTFRQSRIGFAMRTDPTSPHTPSGDVVAFGGYGMTVGNLEPGGAPGVNNVSGWVRQPNGQSSSVADVTLAYVSSNWVKVRMDVLHLATVQDTVTFFTGTGVTGSEVWTQIGQSIVTVASNGYNAPSLASNRTCFIFQSKSGVSAVTSQDYIDRFQVIMSIAS